ncbi:MAG: hypothetical protein LBP95_10850 [Deltaproteobacteria bacterium]|jgi:hypothetical protein|nr:hypothetical protein [Deltaproteobacteria bacterium]
MPKMTLLAILVAALVLLPAVRRAAAWQLQNLSDETRVFDEHHKGQYSPYSKTARPGGWLSFTNQKDIVVVDRKTGQQVNNPNFKMMVVKKEGSLQFR